MAEPQLFFDLQKHLTTNPAFATKIERQLKLISKASKEGNAEAIAHEMHMLLRMCDYNATLLIPYFYPHFPEREPMSLLSRPHAISMMANIPNGTLTIQASRQCGKCLSGLTFLETRSSAQKSPKNQRISEVFEEAKNKSLQKIKNST